MARHGFGLNYAKGLLEIWYSFERDKVSYFQEGTEVAQIDFGKVFRLDSFKSDARDAIYDL
jgi:hypothetical protein